MDIAEGLKSRYDIVIGSKTDPEFYMNVYYYYDFLFKTPQLATIWENSAKEYAKKHGAIWPAKAQTDEEADSRSQQVYKMEHFDLHANGCGLYVRVYLPVDDYKNTSDPDSKQDPNAVALVKGIKYAERVCVRPPMRTKKDISKSFNSWFKDMRSYYEPEFKRFHLLLLDALEPTNLKSKEITFDVSSSILKIAEQDIKISLKNDKTNAHYVLEYMFEKDPNDQSFYTEILEEKFTNEGNWRKVYRACNDIQEKVRKQTGIEDFLEITTGTTGWVRLNQRYR